MKKLLSIMLAFLMVLSMTTAAFADETTTAYSITVKNEESSISINGKTYVAYKLFDMTHAASTETTFPENSAVAYTVATGFEALTYTVGEGEDAVTYRANEHMDETTTSLVEYLETLEDDADTVNAFAKHVWDYITNNSSNEYYKKEVVASNETALFENLDAGYYLVYCTADATDNSANVNTANPDVVAACILTNTNPDATAKVKADVPTIEKIIANPETAEDENSYGAAYDIGSSVEFKLTSKVPDITGYDTYSYVVTDTLSTGLTFNNDVAISVDGTVLDSEYYTVAVDGQTFTITLDDVVTLVNSQIIAEGKGIEITYSATLNKNALATDVETNTVNLTYSSNPYIDTEKTKTPDEVVYVYDFDIEIDKYALNEKDEDDQTAKLANAKFVLKNSAGKFYSVNADTKVVSWVDAQTDATVVVTDANGFASFTGLDEGTYTLIETEAPAGYNKLKDDITVTINAAYNEDGTINTEGTSITKKAGDNDQYYVEQDVKNTTGTLLPTTGGIGTVIFYLIGGILVLGSVVLLVTKKRMNATK